MKSRRLGYSSSDRLGPVRLAPSRLVELGPEATKVNQLGSEAASS
jgi:hypothetical protein